MTTEHRPSPVPFANRVPSVGSRALLKHFFTLSTVAETDHTISDVSASTSQQLLLAIKGLPLPIEAFHSLDTQSTEHEIAEIRVANIVAALQGSDADLHSLQTWQLYLDTVVQNNRSYWPNGVRSQGPTIDLRLSDGLVESYPPHIVD